MLAGPKVLLLGEPGTGKTYSLSTLVEAGVKPFILFTEHSADVVNKALRELKLPKDSYHYMHVASRNLDLDSLVELAENVTEYSYEALTRRNDANKRDHQQFANLMRAFRNFTCARTGEDFGRIDLWGPGRCLVIDNLTGTNKMIMDAVIGVKAVAAQGEWQVAQNSQVAVIDNLVNLMCSLVIIGHLEPETDETTNATRLYAGALGRKVGPKLPGVFSEVIAARREGRKFLWSTMAERTATKSRLLPMADNLEPSFVPLFEAWKEAGGEVEELLSA